MATVHLAHGFIGTGKTTFAKKLEHSERAFRITHHEWMAHLYGIDPPEAEFPKFYERVNEITRKTTKRLLELDQSVILDFGFWTRASRSFAISKVGEYGADYKLYELTARPQL